METSSILTDGIDKLNEVKDQLIELSRMKTRYDSLTKEESDLEKAIKDLEKAIEDETLDTTNNRRLEIEATFNKQIDNSKAKIKKINDKRDKVKSTKVSERIQAETESYKIENRDLKKKIKRLMKENRIPSLCNTKLYFALYFPRGFSDLLIILLMVSIVFLVIPSGIHFFFLPKENPYYLILIYFITIVIFAGLDFLITSRIKEKNRDTFIQIKDIKTKIRVNRKRMSRIKKKIQEDRDESYYGLEKFDEELSSLEQEVADISDKKKRALAHFDKTTKAVIIKQIEERFTEKRNELKSNYDKATSEAAQLDKHIKALTLKIASEYEPYLGKDLMTVNRLESLINIIRSENATNIAEAIAYQKEHME